MPSRDTDQAPSAAVVAHDELLRSLLVERFRLTPRTPAAERAFAGATQLGGSKTHVQPRAVRTERKSPR